MTSELSLHRMVVHRMIQRQFLVEVFGYVREYQGEQIVVISNFSSATVCLTIPEKFQLRAVECLSSNYQEIEKLEENLVLEPYQSIAVLMRE
ncbi:alpha-glucosidase C-terminal domain-containing protein [Vibrio qinghaiensis]|uniref:alpha-glucosidase C-terminal domain-containing protein n=1 Tax=Vibrio qinghaiensis TaxID=2025808 RepID=UPI001FC96521|nr:alpha-glucosidase C-terminal domain-containing protein [Vibrio qinghaiensis]